MALRVGMILSTLTLLFVSACGVEYSHSADAYFVEDWTSAYTKVSNCKQSATHGNNYVEVWVDDNAAEGYTDRSKVIPKDAIVLKAQYSDAGCSTASAWTVIRKNTEEAATEAANWDWQRVEADGSVTFSGQQPGNCSNCHTNCGGNLLCDMP